MKIAIVADSNSGITQDEAKDLGVCVLPMPFMIDGTVYYEGIDLSHEEFYKKMEEGAHVTAIPKGCAGMLGLPFGGT